MLYDNLLFRKDTKDKTDGPSYHNELNFLLNTENHTLFFVPNGQIWIQGLSIKVMQKMIRLVLKFLEKG